MSKVRIKLLPRLFLAAIVFGCLILGIRYLKDQGLLSRTSGPSVVPQQVDLPALVMNTQQDNLSKTALPGNATAGVTSPEIRIDMMAWNAQMGLMFANGGVHTTEGSLMAQKNVNVNLIREDDCGKMQASLLAFAKELKSDPQPKSGIHFAAVMGDGSAAFIAGIQDDLKKICDDCTAEVIGSAGYSRGEDKFMGQAEWKTNPKAARGSLIAGVLRDGDWNIAQKWAGDNAILNNPDEKTWDPEAINWLAANDFIDAGQKYITNVCEDRPIVHAGKRTGESKHICVNGVVTWTPGDVNVAKQKGGLVSVVSTKEYRSQMPNTLVGIKRWNQANKAELQNFLAAMFEGGDQVKAFPEALHKAAEISAAVYKEEKAEYWEKYYKGVTETDKTGVEVTLGGSTANNLADNMVLYGLAPGSANLFAATYTVFGDIVVKQYPKLVSSYPAVGDILNTSYISAVAAANKPTTKADVPTFQANAQIKDVVSKRSWSIEFDTGSATFSPATEKTLKDLANGLLVADDLAIEIHGHTDNTGNANANMTLSQKRAKAVEQWLNAQSSTSFPADRFNVMAHGQGEPVANNSTPEGRAKNRRVVIVLGTTG
jgi:outer membrane protein OmpA-like peptidoglycan-associated protein